MKHIFIINHYPWASITPSLHKLLAHSAHLIELNDCFGIGSLSEEGLETCNKRLRRVCEFHARKVSLTANLTDCLTRM